MPINNPQSGDRHISAALTDVSVAYVQAHDDYAAHKLFPELPVEKSTGKYFVYDKGEWFRDDAKLRSKGQESAGTGFTLSTKTYACEVYAVHDDNGEEDYADADSVFDVDADSTELVTQRLLLREEKRFVDKYVKAGVWTTEETGVDAGPGANQFLRWNDASGKPLTDLLRIRLAVKQLTGMWPNVVALQSGVFDKLKVNSQMDSRLTPTGRDLLSIDLLAKWIDCERGVIFQAIENTAREGATASMSAIAGKHAMVAYAAPRPGRKVPSAGYTMTWSKFTGAGPNGIRVKQFEIPQLGVNRIEGEIATDLNLVAADLAGFAATAIA